MQLFTYNDVD
jgi:hypothetical protein